MIDRSLARPDALDVFGLRPVGKAWREANLPTEKA